MGKMYAIKKKTTKQSATIEQRVDRQLSRRAEKKKAVTSMPSVYGSVGTTWIETDLTSIAQGDLVTNRDGDMIQIYSIKMEGVAQGADVYNVMRVYLALWDGRSSTPLATNGATLDSDITRTVPTGAGLIKCYYDKYLAFSQNYDSGPTNSEKIDYYIKFKTPLRITYTSNTAGTANRRLIIGMLTDSVAIAHPGFIAGRITLTFNDY